MTFREFSNEQLKADCDKLDRAILRTDSTTTDILQRKSPQRGFFDEQWQWKQNPCLEPLLS